MNRGIVRAAVVIAALSASLSVPGPAAADSPVTVNASGPASITADTTRATGRILATFTIQDTSRTATGAKICRTIGSETGQACRYQRFDGTLVDDDDYWDYDDDDDYTRWDIVGEPGSWTVSYPIGFDRISREECLTAAWSDDSGFAATIDVMNDAGVVLGTGLWDYSVNCTGIAGGSTGPDRTRVSASRSTTSEPFNFLVQDSKHRLASYRICRYRPVVGGYNACDREDLTSRNRTKDGWGVSYRLTFNAMGSSACAYIDRKWPDAGFRVDFYDRAGVKRVTLYRYTELRC